MATVLAIIRIDSSYKIGKKKKTSFVYCYGL